MFREGYFHVHILHVLLVLSQSSGLMVKIHILATVQVVQKSCKIIKRTIDLSVLLVLHLGMVIVNLCLRFRPCSDGRCGGNQSVNWSLAYRD